MTSTISFSNLNYISTIAGSTSIVARPWRAFAHINISMYPKNSKYNSTSIKCTGSYWSPLFTYAVLVVFPVTTYLLYLTSVFILGMGAPIVTQAIEYGIRALYSLFLATIRGSSIGCRHTEHFRGRFSAWKVRSDITAYLRRRR